jgi:hypothetical protein
MVVNSVITTPAAGDAVRLGEPLTVKGVAWDGGYGIASVEVSSDGGETWSRATLGPDAGRYSFRQWSFAAKAERKGELAFMARATNAIGQGQTAALIQNPAGYHHNLPHRVGVTVA